MLEGEDAELLDQCRQAVEEAALAEQAAAPSAQLPSAHRGGRGASTRGIAHNPEVVDLTDAAADHAGNPAARHSEGKAPDVGVPPPTAEEVPTDAAPAGSAEGDDGGGFSFLSLFQQMSDGKN